jgi:RNA polymerase sigma factor (TIGR02999 family)
MRQVLVNAARDRMAQKRGGGRIPVSLDDQEFASVVDPEEFLSLHDALDRLETINSRQARIIEYRFFAGLTLQETAQALDVSERTVKRDWRFARAWLGTELGSN